MSSDHSFEKVKEQDIPEIRSTARWYLHRKTKANLLSIVNDDTNKVFGISFKTPPRDSTGVAHILEHTVLRGSRKYPVKDLFGELAKGSLNTFLNAFTYPEKTCYPVASQNLRDFYHLIDVYMDCVLYPLLRKEAFETEGWHYEFDTAEGLLKYQGIVFNEMKGAFSRPRRIVNLRSKQTLLPDTPYAFSSGGDPLRIPDLTYEHVVEFQRTYYHPSNAYLYFWGDDPEERRLEIVDSWLSPFDYRKPPSDGGCQARFAAPRSFSFPCPAGNHPDDASGFRVVVNWMLEQTHNHPTLDLAFSVLSHILVGTHASPLKRALVDSGLGEDVEGGIDSEEDLIQKCFSTGLSGIQREKTDKVEPLILSTLHHVVSCGLGRETVASSMNTIEFALRERRDFVNVSSPLPPGLFFMMRALGPWIHGGDPMSRLAFERPLNDLKNALADDPRFFEGLIRTYLLENPHRVTLTFVPDPLFSSERQEREARELDARKSRMTQEELREVAEHAEFLKRLWDTPDDPEQLAKIPKLSVADVPRENPLIPVDTICGETGRGYFHNLPTNGIVYVDVGFSLEYLSSELIPYVPLFGESLLGMGTKRKSYVQLTQEMGIHTGGMTIETFSKTHVESRQPVSWMFVRGKCLASRAREMLNIIFELCAETRWDERERFRQLALQRKRDVEELLFLKGHQGVLRRMRAHRHPAGRIDEMMNGFEQALFIRQLLRDIESRWENVLRSIERVREEVIHRQGCVVNITSDDSAFPTRETDIERFFRSLPSAAGAPTTRVFEQLPFSEGFVLPSQVNSVGASYDVSGAGSWESGSSRVIESILSRDWLWNRLRVRGGAYGARVSFDGLAGQLYFFSSRDPNVGKTVSVYRQAGDFLRKAPLGREELERHIIAALRGMDPVLSPDEKGWLSLQRVLMGDSDERRQRMRDQVFSTSLDDVRRVGSLLVASLASEHIVVLGPRESLRGFQEERGKDFIITQLE